MKIKNIVPREIFDSRGEPTLEIELIAENKFSFRAQIPSGKSRGKNEAAVFSFKQAKKSVQKIKKFLQNKNFSSIHQLDKYLIKQDNTDNKKNLGGNVMLGISIAFARALAHRQKQELWQVLQSEFFKKEKRRVKTPLIFSNLINGGTHAENNLDFQEYLVIVKPSLSLIKDVEQLIAFYKKLGLRLKKQFKLSKLILGDEGGYSLNFKNSFEPLLILKSLIKKSRLTKKFKLGLDAAASNFYKNKKYLFGKKTLSTQELLKIYGQELKKNRLFHSIEDPFFENDYAGFKALTAELKGKLIIGDDLTTTNPLTIEKCAKQKLINAVIIKPNQIGTVFETCQAINMAHKNKLKCVISHRSGETEDNFIIHFARASNAYGVKIGAPARERLLKFDELLKIYK